MTSFTATPLEPIWVPTSKTNTLIMPLPVASGGQCAPIVAERGLTGWQEVIAPRDSGTGRRSENTCQGVKANTDSGRVACKALCQVRRWRDTGEQHTVRRRWARGTKYFRGLKMRDAIPGRMEWKSLKNKSEQGQRGDSDHASADPRRSVSPVPAPPPT